MSTARDGRPGSVTSPTTTIVALSSWMYFFAMSWTSAGVTAGIDLALAIVEEDHGHTVAMGVARQLVVFLKRPGGQAQFSAALATQVADHQLDRRVRHIHHHAARTGRPCCPRG